MATPQPTITTNLPSDPTTSNWEGVPLRTFKDRNGHTWFIAKDVCDALDISNPTMALRSLEDDEKGLTTVETLGGVQSLTTVNEPGLYSLVLRSRKPEAKAFKRWVTHAVLPAIRRDGVYIKGEERLLESASLEELQARVQEMQARAAQAVDLKVSRGVCALEEREARAVALKSLSRGRRSTKRRRVVIPAGEV
ncbi:MAG: hypothetical protein EOP38_01700 [Rubrivivax sp.]|nr:MAG: hypothetical protein EOP38_01700 [Rubrivivax sp.]